MNVCSEGYSNRWVCTQCGVCAGICPFRALTMASLPHGYRYPSVDADRCTSCGLCLRVCPGPRLTSDANRDRPHDLSTVYGPLVRIGLGWATDQQLRGSASSGGLVSALLIAMLARRSIAGAIVTDLGAEGCSPRTRLVHAANEVREARGSKYMITSLNEALQQAPRCAPGPVAVVGTPCQIRGVRVAIQTGAISGRPPLLIALFCGGTKDYRYRSFLSRRMSLDDTALRRFAFRGGGWPGEASGEDANGHVATLSGGDSDVGRIWSRAHMTPPRCLLCDDPLCETADIVVGDPWRISSGCDELGKSLFIARTSSGSSAITQATATGALQIDECIEQAQVIHSTEGILWRRHYAPVRVKLAALWARAWRSLAHQMPGVPLPAGVRAARAMFISQTRGAAYTRGLRKR